MNSFPTCLARVDQRPQHVDASMTTVVTAMEGEIVLLAMLPEEDRVMMVQTSCLRTIADLEDFIVDEYSRVFPHMPALSRDLRIQKCVAPDLVVDRRTHTKARQQSPHCFVDLAKNVQAGNVFKNMEQIYVVINQGPKKHKAKSPQNQDKPQKLLASEAHSSEKTKNAKFGKDASKQTPNTTMSKAAAQNNKAANKADAKDAPDAKKKKKKNTVVDKESKKSEPEKKQDTKKKAAKETKQPETVKAAEKATHEAKHAAPKANLDAKEATAKPKQTEKDNKDSTLDNLDKKFAVETEPVQKVTKKVAPKKSENALLKKMLAAKHDATDSGAALIVNSIQTAAAEAPAPKASLKSEKTRKASEKDSVATGGSNNSESQEPPAKKKKTSTKSDAKQTEESAEEKQTKTEKPAKKKASKVEAAKSIEAAVEKAEPKTQKTVKKKAAAKSLVKNDDDSSTTSESTPASRKSKKKIETDNDVAEKPATKRAKKETSPKEATTKKEAEKSKSTEKVDIRKPVTSKTKSNSSSSSSSSSSQADEASGENTDVAKAPAPKTSPKQKDGPTKPGFQAILAATKKRIEDEQKAKAQKVDKLSSIAKPERTLQETVKSSESTASESSSDSDVPPAVVKGTKRSPKNVAPAESSSSSSSSSDEEELDYSQSLLADLTKNG
ncbi:unnamed protein product [Phytophthora fragariaefolia]|uniref:Unnamed protein product n=1 Tax=Phytophthora fragariaefolia TaxID=1490495 RepID=A0A9W6YL83_9STRA|nr:unnamed protein product [Phytophthora fragariaefolia]